MRKTSQDLFEQAEILAKWRRSEIDLPFPGEGTANAAVRLVGELAMALREALANASILTGQLLSLHKVKVQRDAARLVLKEMLAEISKDCDPESGSRFKLSTETYNRATAVLSDLDGVSTDVTKPEVEA